MPSNELLLTLIAAALLVAYLPGPGLLYAAAQTIGRGRKAGLMAACGLHVGGYFHVGASAAGLSAVFHAIPTMYLVVKFIGAAYLVLLGLRMIRRSLTGCNEHMERVVVDNLKSGRRAFLESVTVEALNPKTALFFIAFLPQFVDPSAAFPVWVQFFILGVIVNVILSSADLLCVFFAGIVVERLRESGRISNYMERVGGGILVGLGLHLAVQRN